MKIKNLLSGLAVAGLTLASGLAATSVNTPDSVLLGFRNNGSDTNFVTGKDTYLFVGLNGLQRQTFNINQLMINQFGSDWYTSGVIRWGVYGANFVLDENSPTGVGPGTGTFVAGSSETLSLANGTWGDGNFPTFGETFNTLKSNLSGVSSNATVGVGSSSGVEYTYGVISGQDYTAALNIPTQMSALLGGKSGEFDLTVSTTLDINSYVPNETLDGYASHSIPGVLTVESSGLVTVVPEPSTYVLLGLGAVIGFVAMRRSKRA
jgi:hypothetical protein